MVLGWCFEWKSLFFGEFAQLCKHFFCFQHKKNHVTHLQMAKNQRTCYVHCTWGNNYAIGWIGTYLFQWKLVDQSGFKSGIFHLPGPHKLLVIETSYYLRVYGSSTSPHFGHSAPLIHFLWEWSLVRKGLIWTYCYCRKKESLVFLPTCYILAVHCPFIKYLHKYSYLLMYEQL